MKISISCLFFFLTLIVSSQEVEELSWPREVDLEQGLLTFYQPQPESFEANILEGRSAISFKPTNGEMAFGAYWFRAFLQTDMEDRTAILDQVDVMRIKFPGLEDSTKVARASQKIQELLEDMDIVMSLDRLIASLDEAGVPTAEESRLNHTPPDLYYRKAPTVLISVDGDPIWKDFDQANLKAVVNSPFFIVQDSKSKNYYINGGEYWYVSSSLGQEGWTITSDIPKNIKRFAEENAPKKQEESEAAGDETSRDQTPPAVLLVTKPSELIVTDGEPDYQAIEGTELLYVKNTDSDVIMDINTQQHYVIVAGRWYKAKQLGGNSWEFEEPNDLPADFSKIPADSDLGSVRANVPGTDEAKDALLEQSIPQTAEVNRKEAKIEVNFDGTPKFKQVPDADVSYAENSDKQVLKINRKYYAVDNGIWFISDYPEGPYAVSDHRPEEVDQLPPDTPVYNTKYVYVYDSTPEVVYVGYLPGYTYSYVYGGTVIYGTGFYYQYWYGAVYYPRPVTYGFSVHWNPHTGWGFSFGISAGGWIGWGYHPYYRPYWGPCGYRAGYRHGYYHGYNRGLATGYAAGYRAGQRNAYLNQRSGVNRTTTRDRVNPSRTDKSRPSTRQNNLYSDRNGNVYQRDKSGNWQEKRNTRDMSNRQNNTPKTIDRSNNVDLRNKDSYTQPKTRDQATTRQNQTRNTQQNRTSPSSGNYGGSDLNRSYQNRQRGQANYQRSRSSGSRSMPSRGGGGMRRR